MISLTVPALTSRNHVAYNVLVLGCLKFRADANAELE